MANNPFEDLARELPDGAFWVTGRWLKRLFAALTADRVRAGANLDELPSDKGRTFNAKAGSSTAVVTTPPLTVVDASATDADGTTHAGRVRVYAAFLGSGYPTQMKIPDAVLPDGTDNHCYLTLQPGTSYLYAKTLVDPDSNFPTTTTIYSTDSEEDPDGTYVYLLFAVVTLNADGTFDTPFNQIATGNKSVEIACTPDGKILSPTWTTL